MYIYIYIYIYICGDGLRKLLSLHARSPARPSPTKGRCTRGSFPSGFISNGARF